MIADEVRRAEEAAARAAAFLDERRAASRETPDERIARLAAAIPRAEGDWPDPQPLVAHTGPRPYPVDALPPRIRAAVEEVQAFTQAPMPLVASSALGALSVAIQALADVRRAEGLEGPTSLFLLTIADSGERKSTSDELFVAAVRDFERERERDAKPDLARYAADLEAWSAKRDGLKARIRDAARNGEPADEHQHALRELDMQRPSAPRIPKMLRVDETPEHLAYALAHEWPSAAIVSAEGGLVLGAHAMNRDSILRSLSLFNLLWDGGALRIGRRTSESYSVRGARLTLALQVQEQTLRAFFERADGLARGSGFLSRFLLAWPESTQGTRAFREPPATWPALAAFNRRVLELLAQPVAMSEEGALMPAMLPLRREAKEAWTAFHDAVESELRLGGELYDVRDVASKAAENAARLAALLHVFECGLGAVGAEAFAGASRIVAWHLSEARRFLGELALPSEIANAVRLDTWLRDYCALNRTHIVPRREVQRGGPARLRSRDALAAALRELEDAGRVRVRDEGRRRDIQVNPLILGLIE